MTPQHPSAESAWGDMWASLDSILGVGPYCFDEFQQPTVTLLTPNTKFGAVTTVTADEKRPLRRSIYVHTVVSEL